jgi:hypothetical protein
MGNLHEDQYTFFYHICSILLRMRKVSDKSCTENKNHTSMFSNFLSKTVLLWDNVEAGRPQMIIWHVRMACWVPKTTNTHSG